MRVRATYHIARADFLERVRRYSFLVTLLFAVYLGYAAATGKIALRLAVYRGVYTSAWIGVNMALVATCFISLVGYYIVKNAIERDHITGVGEILAPTPLPKPLYLLGKWLSNTAVLAAQVVVLAFAAVVMQFIVGEDPHFDLWALLAPFLLLALPAIFLTGALALLFETLPVLRGGVGNSGYPTKVASGLRWQGMRWDLPQVLLRLQWIGVALALVLLATLFFDRFDPARGRGQPRVRHRSRQELKRGTATVTEPTGTPAQPPGARAVVQLTPLTRAAGRWGLLRMLAAELRLTLKGYPWWWYAVAVGPLVAPCAAPLEISRGPLLTAAWIWPILLWSAMGARETRHGTEQLIFSAPRVLPRQLPAGWLVGVLIAVATGGGVAVSLLLAASYPSLLAWFAGALFVPTLALALGVWTGSSRAFEGFFTAIWYIGPLNRVPGFDFTGAANGAHTTEFASVYLVLTIALLTAALLGRRRHLRRA